MIYARTLLCVFVLISAASAHADPWQDAVDIYSKGDYPQAIALFEQLAEEGNAKAQFRLGAIYYKGEVVPKDNSRAARWFEMAAEQGVADAQLSIAIMYANGYGVPLDNVYAYMWYNLAVAFEEQNDSTSFASYLRKELAREMTPSQIAEAQKLSREWLEKFHEQKE